MAKAKIKKAPAKDAQTRDVHTPIPSRVLTVLLIAFGGALGLKAWEERRASDDAHAAQQARESMAIASIVGSPQPSPVW